VTLLLVLLSFQERSRLKKLLEHSLVLKKAWLKKICWLKRILHRQGSFLWSLTKKRQQCHQVIGLNVVMYSLYKGSPSQIRQFMELVRKLTLELLSHKTSTKPWWSHSLQMPGSPDRTLHISEVKTSQLKSASKMQSFKRVNPNLTSKKRYWLRGVRLQAQRSQQAWMS
jgi:hypothetical protein